MKEKSPPPHEADPTRRFSDRVADYLKSRPRYPVEVLTYLRETIDLKPTDRVADVGSGTGFLSELFLSNRNRVIGVEPNVEMRLAAEAIMADNPEFISQDGTAEATGLENASVDLVVAGQAFHWFDPVKTKTEFRRVLKPGGQVALIWNVRQLDGSQFMQAYETMLRSYSQSYAQVNHQDNTGEEILEMFFAPGGYRSASFPNVQYFTYEGLRSRLLSSSYSPQPGRPDHAPMMDRLQALYDQHEMGGTVTFVYKTVIYIGLPGA